METLYGSGENWERIVGMVRKKHRGTRRRYPLSSNTFILVLERILVKIRDTEQGGVTICGTRMNKLAFADDIDLIDTDG